MRRITTLTAGVLTAALATAALSGCTSSGNGGDAKPSATATPSAAPTTTAAKHVDGHLDYTGASTGSVDFTGGVACEVVAGKLVGVTSPDISDPKALTKAVPSFIAATAPYKLGMLVTPDRRSYAATGGADGLEGHGSGAAWTVTVRNMKLPTTDGHPGVTVNGSLTCTRVTAK
jgi:hypothetical protein